MINKSIQPSTLAEPIPGVPKQTAQVKLTVANTGNVSANRLVLTDEDVDPAAPTAVPTSATRSRSAPSAR